jgi:hypothetical protein
LRRRLAEEVRVPVAQVGVLPCPRPSHVCPADMAAAPWPPPDDLEHRGQGHHAQGEDQVHGAGTPCSP